MYTPLQQETDRFKAGRSAVLPQNRPFLFQMPNELPQNRRCLPDVYPPKRPWHKGLLVFYPSAPSTRRATPFECQKAAKRLLRGRFAAFFLSRMLGIWYRHAGGASACFRRCEQLRSSSSPLEAARKTAGRSAGAAKK